MIYAYWVIIIIIIIIIWPTRPWPWPGPDPGPRPGPDWLEVGGKVLGGLAGGFLLSKGLGMTEAANFSEAVLSGFPVMFGALLGGGLLGRLSGKQK